MAAVVSDGCISLPIVVRQLSCMQPARPTRHATGSRCAVQSLSLPAHPEHRRLHRSIEK